MPSPRTNPRIPKKVLPPEITKGQQVRGQVNEDRILRSMPITQSQLRQIKKHYGIK